MLTRCHEAGQNIVQQVIEEASSQGIALDCSAELTNLLHRVELADSLPVEVIGVVSVLLEWIARVDIGRARQAS